MSAWTCWRRESGWPARHQTLRKAIDWSYELLSPDEAELFRSLAVFANGCTLEAAATVVGGEPSEALARLTTLVDKSLLVASDGPAGEPRFRFLETVREYALERLRAREEEASARAAHARYVLTFIQHTAPHLWTDQRDYALVEHDNVRAALRWLLDEGDVDAAGQLVWWLALLWWTRGLLGDAPRWGEQVLAAAGSRWRLARARGACAAFIGYFFRGDFARAHELVNQAEADFRAAGDVEGIGLTLAWRAFFAPRYGSIAKALGWLREAVAAFQEAGNDWGVAIALNGIGDWLAVTGDFAGGEAYTLRALNMAYQMGDRRSIGQFLQQLGFNALLRGDPRRAQALFADALPPLLETGHVELLAYSLSGVAMLALRQGQLPRAARLEAVATTLRQKLGLVVWPVREALYADTLDTLRRRMDQPEVEHAWNDGTRMTASQAVAYAVTSDEPEGPTHAGLVRQGLSRQGLSAREAEVAGLIARGGPVARSPKRWSSARKLPTAMPTTFAPSSAYARGPKSPPGLSSTVLLRRRCGPDSGRTRRRVAAHLTPARALQTTGLATIEAYASVPSRGDRSGDLLCERAGRRKSPLLLEGRRLGKAERVDGVAQERYL